MRLRLLAAIVLLSSGLAARANIIYDLSGVTLAGGGTLTGTFTTNNADTTVLAVNIVASHNGSFAGFNYTFPTGGTNNSSLPTFLRIDQAGDELQLVFTGGLKASGANLSGYDAEGGNRSITAGSVVAETPEPSSLFLLGTGLLGAVGAVRRRYTPVA